MATLSGLVSRIAAAAFLALALATLGAATVAAQTTEPPAAQHPDGTGASANAPGAGSAVAPALPNPAGHDSAPTAISDTSPSSETSSAGSGAYAIHAALKSFDTPLRSGDMVFDRASELFPAFCKDWQRRLHDRELNNLENITWKDASGWKTGTYLAYSPVKTCTCKRSTGGVPIGELTYQETQEYLAGRTVEEARHAPPKAVGITNTTEIFRWDKTKWDDGR
jgi:hypothetical protein